MNMQLRLRRAASAVLLLSTLSLWPALAGAQTVPDDRAALDGLKEVKVAFDVTTGDAKKLLGTLT